MADKRIKDLPAFSGTLPSSAVFAMETNAATKKVDLATLRNAIGTLGQKNIGANGTYEAANDGLYGYNKAVVNVPNTYVAGDEGKVVQNGALVAQTTRNVNANGTYNTTTNNQTVVAVPNTYSAADEGKVVDDGALVAQTSRTVTENGIYDTTLNDELTVSVAGGGGSMTLAKIGSSSTIETVSGDYGPMGDYTADYLTPVNGQTRQDVEIDTAQPYNIEVAFKIASLPVNRVAIFGALDATNAPMPAMFIDAGGTGIRFRIPYTFDGAILYYEDYFTTTEMGGTVPLNTEIKVSVGYNGTSSHGASYEVGAEGIVASVDDLTPVSVTGGLCIGANGAGTSAALAGETGAYIVIEDCEIKQGTTTLWPGGAFSLIPLNVTANGAYLPQSGVDGFNMVMVNVPNAGALAKLGDSTEIVTVSGLYGPMGDAEDDYVVPVNDNRNDVTVNTGQPFEVKCTFRIPSALPTNATTYILGQNGGAPFPSLYVRYSSTDGYYFTIRGSYEDGGTVVNRTVDFGTGAVLPTNTDIETVIAYDGTDLTATVNYGTTTLSGTIDNISLVEHSAAKCMLGADLYGTGGLSGISGAYLNIDKCYIKQGDDYLWRVQGNVTVEPLTVTQNGTYTAPAGSAYSPVMVNMAPNSWNGPYVSTIPGDISDSGIIQLAVGNHNIVSEGLLKSSAIGHNILVFCFLRDGDPAIPDVSISGFTMIHTEWYFRFFYGTLTANTEIAVTGQYILASIVEISDDYEAVMYSNLTGKRESTQINTNYLKTADAFKISAALPSGYGIMVLGTAYDYTSGSDRPSIWQPLNMFINHPEIIFRRTSGGNLFTGVACFLKMNPEPYNQYYLRGSAAGNIAGSTMVLPSKLTSLTAINKYTTIPTWSNNTLSIAYIQLQRRTT